MLDESEVPRTFLGEVFQIVVNILNKVNIRVKMIKHLMSYGMENQNK
jgi:hypothetical protein